MNSDAVKTLVCRLFDLAYCDLKSTGKNRESAEEFFTHGYYQFYAGFIDSDETKLYNRYRATIAGSYRQLELFT